jgi:hypothetical protein
MDARSSGRLFNQRMLEPWGSKSIKAGRCPATAKQAARFVASVVFPEPPLGLRMIILCMESIDLYSKARIGED